jgi:hypothetical protein
MNKIEIVYGLIIGILASFLGCALFIALFTPYSFINGIALVKAGGNLGKLITLGTILNIIIFFLLLYFKKELMARGVVLATLILAVYTLFV